MKLTLNTSGVFLDGVAVPHCQSIDIHNINISTPAEATLHLGAHGIDEVEENLDTAACANSGFDAETVIHVKVSEIEVLYGVRTTESMLWKQIAK